MVDTAGPAPAPAAGRAGARPRPAPARRGPALRAPVVAAGLVAVAGAAAAVAAWRTGAVEPLVLPGITVSDATVLWLLPVVVAAAQAAQVLTLGALLAAAVLFPAEPRRSRTPPELSPAGWYAARTAARAAVVWCVLAFALVPLTTADLLGQPLGALSVRSVVSTAFSVETGREYLVVGLAALACAVVGAVALTRRAVVAGLAAGVLAVAAQASAGHSSASGDHQLAVSSLLLHLLGVVAWAGGLVALDVLARRLPTADLAVAARRFSPLAGVAAALVTFSGVGNALVRLGADPSRWGETAYGPLVGVKLLATLVLLGVGAWHRRRTLPALAAGDRRAFVRLATGEAAVFGIVLGLAAALSRTAPPPTGRAETAVESTLGFALPPAPTPARIAFDVYPEPVFLAVALGALALYAVAVVRLRRAGTPWPVGRSLAWAAGWLVVVVATGSGLARYAFVLTAAHVGQQVALLAVAAPLLAAGAPVGLALRYAPLRVATALRSTPVRWATQPLVVLVLAASVPFVVYDTAVYGWALRSHWWHLAAMGYALAAGVLLFEVVLGEPVPGRPGPAARIAMLVTVSLVHIGFGVLLTRAGTPLVPGWWAEIARPWWPDTLADTRAAGTVAWVGSTAAALVVLAALGVVRVLGVGGIVETVVGSTPRGTRP